MDQHVAEGNDLRHLRNSRRGARVSLRQALDGFADDLEVAFDGLAQQPIRTVDRERSALRHVADESRGVANVFKPLR